MTCRCERPKAALKWAEEMFGEKTARDPLERARRLLEEAIELAQAAGLDLDAVSALAARVYLRPPGDIEREVGQVAMTLEVLAANIGLDADAEASREFARVRHIPKQEWEARHAAKAAQGIARPVDGASRYTLPPGMVVRLDSPPQYAGRDDVLAVCDDICNYDPQADAATGGE
jgi:hypothetical protein